MKDLGTILPSWRDMERADAIADMQREEDERKGAARWPACKRRVVVGEVRWYEADERRYHTMRHGMAHTFEVREDGDYAVG